MNTYFAVTTTNYLQNGYEVVAQGNNKNECEQQAHTYLAQLPDNIYTQTMATNLKVVSKTKFEQMRAARRKDFFAVYGYVTE